MAPNASGVQCTWRKPVDTHSLEKLSGISLRAVMTLDFEPGKEQDIHNSKGFQEVQHLYASSWPTFICFFFCILFSMHAHSVTKLPGCSPRRSADCNGSSYWKGMLRLGGQRGKCGCVRKLFSLPFCVPSCLHSLTCSSCVMYCNRTDRTLTYVQGHIDLKMLRQMAQEWMLSPDTDGELHLDS